MFGKVLNEHVIRNGESVRRGNMSSRDVVDVGQIEVIYGARTNRFSQTIAHRGLHKHRVFTHADQWVVMEKVETQLAEWDRLWQTRVERADAKQAVEDNKLEAQELTEEAQKALRDLETILAAAKKVEESQVWNDFVGQATFPEAQPKPTAPPPVPVAGEAPAEPNPSQPPHKFKPGLLDYLLPGRMAKQKAKSQAAFDRVHAAWRDGMGAYQDRVMASRRLHEKLVAKVRAANELANTEWLARKAAFDSLVAARKEEATRLCNEYHRHQADGVIAFIDGVLSASQFPECFVPNWKLAYDPQAKTVIAEYNLPAPADLPRLKEVRYVASRDEQTESFVTEAQANKMYDSALYQTALRVAFEVFSSDAAKAVELFCLNGMVTAVNPATGYDTTACILSFQVKRDEFMHVNLQAVDPKECFRRFKGVASAKLSGLAAIPPIQRMNREDARFVDGRAVIDNIDTSVNLAAMPWEDFEHLIRELFGREFSSPGSEVKVTRASRDAGVDAVIFDADPIRGGKIVVQAKRYTNTVDVSAVRDLFGTIHNEGAIKGILVTTSTYGPDAYSFAQDKPITLINGGNLLSLLERHGTKARIDMKEAKELHRAAAK
jgi:restriction system protein